MICWGLQNLESKNANGICLIATTGENYTSGRSLFESLSPACWIGGLFGDSSTSESHNTSVIMPDTLSRTIGVRIREVLFLDSRSLGALDHQSGLFIGDQWGDGGRNDGAALLDTTSVVKVPVQVALETVTTVVPV